MEFEVSYTLENEQQFWDELDDILLEQRQSHELIDNALRSYFLFGANYKGSRPLLPFENAELILYADEYLRTEYDIARCSYRLIDSALFAAHKDYVRRQIVCSLLQEDAPETLHLIAAFLLFDGRQNDNTFEMMNEEGVFTRLLELIYEKKFDDAGLHRMLLELLYEMSRMQRLRTEDLMLIEDDFIAYMFQIIEGYSDDVNDPYHYPVIRVLLILNEQYMVCAHDPSSDQSKPPIMSLTNKVIRTLSTHGSAYKTFGENIILLLNRESETSLQLLILKLLYLLFTSPPTYEYFYTNDLHVLLDIILRNLLDLPSSSTALRHTYLRVLYPFLSHTQLKHPPHYKRGELTRLLAMMSGGATDHFGDVDETTQRLVRRCARVEWLRDEGLEGLEAGGSPTKLKQRLLSVGNLATAMESSISVVEVASQRSKPGVQTPSRTNEDARDQSKDGVALDPGEEVVGKVLEAGTSPFDVGGEA